MLIPIFCVSIYTTCDFCNHEHFYVDTKIEIDIIWSIFESQVKIYGVKLLYPSTLL